MRLDLLRRDLVEPFASRELVLVMISRHELVSLLGKLEQPVPLRTMVSCEVYRDGRRANDVVLVLQAENEAWSKRQGGHGPARSRLDALLTWLFDGKENDR